MIPRAFVTHWATQVPWPTLQQAEQDMLLSRLVIEFANDTRLGPELAFRGGTCLHKLHLPAPLRYSEDLDYCRTTTGPVGKYVSAIREIGHAVGFSSQSEIKKRTATVRLRCDSTEPGPAIRIKIETNVLETTPWRPLIRLNLAVNSSWWSGAAQVPTFELEEMLGTKVRALYQRRKGRDLMDLWLGLAQLAPASDALIVEALRHYMGEGMFSLRDLRANVEAKLQNVGFLNDVSNLTTAIPAGYSPEAAAVLLFQRLGPHLPT